MYPMNHGNALLPRHAVDAINVLVVASAADTLEIEDVLKGAVIAEAERFEGRDRFSVVCVGSLESARRALKTWCFDAILIDVEQPDRAVGETICWGADFSQELPLLLLCETADAGVSQDAITAGIQACLHKDRFELSQLPETILRSIDNHALIALSEAAVVH